MFPVFQEFPPLRFHPIFRSYLWGGRRLATDLNKNLPEEGIWAESWEIVDHPQAQSLVAEGPWQDWSLGKLMETYPASIVGPNATIVQDSKSLRFPLLLKYLDCQNVLSVQVHPDDAYGATLSSPDLGKTEAWVILARSPGARVYAGLRPGITKQTLREAIATGRTEECLHSFEPCVGDCIFIPAGTVHALGAGLLVAEIQQASDCTFRLFDWNRVDQDGKPRPLHIEQALEVIDFERGPVQPIRFSTDRISTSEDGADVESEVLVRCDKFCLERFRQPGLIRFAPGTFRIVTVPHGAARLESALGAIDLAKGESALIPFSCSSTSLVVQQDSSVLVASQGIELYEQRNAS
jgi:mannose-6-phosphate isomerase